MFLSPGFYIGIGLLLLAGIGSSFEAVSYARSHIKYDSNLNFLIVFQTILYSDLFTAAIALVCPLSYAAAFLEEQQSRFLLYNISRCSYTKYFSAKLITVALSGGLSVGSGILLAFGYSMLASGSAKAPGMLQMLFSFLLSFGLAGCMFAVTGGVFAALLKNKYMAYAVPFILYYIFTAFQRRYYKSLYYLSPQEWMTGMNLPGKIGIWILIVVLAAAGGAYVGVMRRRVRHG